MSIITNTFTDRRSPGAGHPAWWIVAGGGLAVLLPGLLTTGTWARRTPARAGT